MLLKTWLTGGFVREHILVGEWTLEALKEPTQRKLVRLYRGPIREPTGRVLQDMDEARVKARGRTILLGCASELPGRGVNVIQWHVAEVEAVTNEALPNTNMVFCQGDVGDVGPWGAYVTLSSQTSSALEC